MYHKQIGVGDFQTKGNIATGTQTGRQSVSPSDVFLSRASDLFLHRDPNGNKTIRYRRSSAAAVDAKPNVGDPSRFRSSLLAFKGVKIYSS